MVFDVPAVCIGFDWCTHLQTIIPGATPQCLMALKCLAVSRHLDFSIDRLFLGLLESPFTKTILFLENCRHSQGKHNVFKSFYRRVASNINPLHSKFLTRLLVLRFNLYQGCPDVT